VKKAAKPPPKPTRVAMRLLTGWFLEAAGLATGIIVTVLCDTGERYLF
jgi:cysteine synthase